MFTVAAPFWSKLAGGGDTTVPFTATFLLRYDGTTDNRWEDAVTGSPNGPNTDTYTASIGKVELDTAETLFGLSSGKLNYGVTTRAGSWDYGGNWSVPEWPTTGDFTAEFFCLPKSGMGSGVTDPRKGGWLYNSGGLGHASVGNIDKTAYQNKGAYSLFLDTDLSLQFSQGKGQDAAAAANRITLQSSAGVITEGVWNHIAMVRASGVWYIYAGPVGGTAVEVMTGTELMTSIDQSNSTLGGMWCANRPSPLIGAFVGHIAEYRTANTALRSGSFLVPSAPLLLAYP